MWDERYAVEHYIYGEQPNDFLKENYQRIPKGRVLSLAEGEGRNAVFLAEQGYEVTAVDSSLVGLNKARKLAAQRGVSIEFVHADVKDFPIGESQWDGVVSIFCHVAADLRSQLHKNIVAGLKPLGVLLLEAYTPQQLGRGTGGPSQEALMMSQAQLLDELNGLHFLLLHEVQRDVVEGTHHTGAGEVVQVIAIKESL